ERSVGRKARRGVQSAGLVEDALMAGEPAGQRAEHARRHYRTRAHRRAAHLDLLERGLAADPARRVRQVAAIAHILGNWRSQPDGDDVEQLLVIAPEAVRDAVEVVRAGKQSLGEAQ